MPLPIIGGVVAAVPTSILLIVGSVVAWRQVNRHTKTLVFTALLAMIYDATFAEDREFTLNDLAVVGVAGYGVHRVGA